MWLPLLSAAGGFVAGVWLYYLLRLYLFVRRQPSLAELRALATPQPAPRVGVIVPACNEAAAIGSCLESLLDQEYLNVQVVAVDDRSTDGTGAIMDELAGRRGGLRVIHVDHLPAGWLGKNHANWVGAGDAFVQDCDFLLFTDGDVIFSPDCLRWALSYAVRENLDHLCVFPHMLPGGFLEGAMCHFFGLCFLLRCRPWHLRDPRKPDAFMGVGAFNLVRRSAYAGIGTHRAMRLEVLDDYKLGKLLKAQGCRCDGLDGWGSIRVRWHVGLGGVVRGLEKNGFAGTEFSLWRLAGALATMMVLFLGPYIGVILAPGMSRAGFLLTILLQVGAVGSFGRRGGRTVWLGLAFPICAGALAWALVRSAAMALWRGGIDWRGTLYPLAELRANRV